MINRAAEIGHQKYDWWLDWRGECVAIIASGYSVKGLDLSVLRDRIHVLAIKENVELVPWCDVVYGCDAPWWVHKRGLPEFKGLKLSYAPVTITTFPDIKRFDIPRTNVDEILVDEPAKIGCGGNSGFQALNIAVQFGATGVMLIGFDMGAKSDAQLHWYGRNDWKHASNPNQVAFNRWIKAFGAAVHRLRLLGIEVVNVSHSSALNCFPRVTIDEGLRRWGL